MTTTQNYVIKTDGFEYECDAKSLDAAIAEAFNGEGLGKIVDVASLEKKFAKYVDEGGWCLIEEDGKRVVEIGECE
jgi:hypothetical protein